MDTVTMDTTTDKKPQTLLVLEELKRNSRINKHQHFCAGERNSFYNNIFGSVAIIINVILGSFLLSDLLPGYARWISAFLSVFAAACCGVQTFFNFQKVFEGHRKTANSYLELQRECERLIALFTDNLIDTERLAVEVEVVSKEYGRVNKTAEVFPTGDKDFRRAMKHEKLIADNAPST
jgi:hypothetical protein